MFERFDFRILLEDQPFVAEFCKKHGIKTQQDLRTKIMQMIIENVQPIRLFTDGNGIKRAFCHFEMNHEIEISDKGLDNLVDKNCEALSKFYSPLEAMLSAN